MKKLAILAVLGLSVASAGCTTEDRYTAGGTVAGGAAGALAGQAIGRNTESTVIGAAIGAGVGAVAGNVIGRSQRTNEPLCEYSDGVVRPCPPGY